MPGPPRDDSADDATGAFPTAGDGEATAAFSLAPDTPPVWKIAGRYRVIARIGAGGMADVMRARDELLARDVAVKVFRATPPTPDTASGVQRQHAELHALARLNHPNLTMLFDGSIVGQDGPAYLVMELIDGPSLAQKIESGGLSEAQTREVGAQIADALAYVHAADMVHRDVKPANILLGSDRIVATESIRARLTDFGIVRLVGNEPMTRVDMTLGSASYLAPEQARGSSVGPPADIYALGLSLIETLSGRRSFEGPPLEAVMARLASDPEIPAGLPQPWPGLLRAMTARDPADRPTAHQVAQALRSGAGPTGSLGAAAAGGVGAAAAGAGAADAAVAATGYLPRSAATPPPPMPPVRRPQREDSPPPPYDPPPAHLRGWLIAAGILVALLIVIGVAIAATSGNGGSGSPSTDPSTSAPVTSTKASSHASTRDDSTSSAPSTAASTPKTEQDTPTPSSASSTASSSASRSKSASPSQSSSASRSASRTATGTRTTTPPPANAAQPVGGSTSSPTATR